MRRSLAVPSVLAALAVSTFSASALAQSSAVVLSEFRTSTPQGGLKDELIEIHNTTCSPVDVSGLSVRYGSCSLSDASVAPLVAQLPANTVIQPNGFYLLANTGYEGPVAADQPFANSFAELLDSEG